MLHRNLPTSLYAKILYVVRAQILKPVKIDEMQILIIIGIINKQMIST